MEFLHLIERYKRADEIERNYLRERLDGNQRFQQMLRPTDLGGKKASLSSEKSPSRLRASSAPPTLNMGVRKIRPACSPKTPEHAEQRRKHRDEKIALWESTLPTPTSNEPGHITPGYSYCNIPIGASSKRTVEDFRTKPKSKKTFGIS
jgi:hypothetical protein